MNSWQIIASAVLAILSAAVILFCLWSLYYGEQAQAALIGGILLLGLAQLISLVSRANTPPTAKSAVASMSPADTQAIEALAKRVGQLENQNSDQPSAAVSELTGQVSATENRTGAFDANPPPVSSEPARSHRSWPSSPGVDLDADPARHDLFLEPIIRVGEARTVYYRANLALRRNDGSHIDAHTIAERAGKTGNLSKLDLVCFERAAPVIRHLIERKRGIGVFCPVAPESFADDAFIKNLLSLIERNQDVAGALVIEITQASFGALSEHGTHGLVYLAELGAAFSLCKAELDLPDAKLLSDLGFGFLDIDIAQLCAGAEGRRDASQVRVACSEHDMSLIAANVTSENQLTTLAGMASLARGPLFSPPRQVRGDL